MVVLVVFFVDVCLVVPVLAVVLVVVEAGAVVVQINLFTADRGFSLSAEIRLICLWLSVDPFAKRTGWCCTLPTLSLSFSYQGFHIGGSLGHRAISFHGTHNYPRLCFSHSVDMLLP